MDEFELELKMGFLDEAAQLLGDAEQSMLKLESSPNDPLIVDQLFRLAHNLKGSSKAVGFPEMGELTHRLESLLLKIKSKEFLIKTDTINLFLRSIDALQKAVVLLKTNLAASLDFKDLIVEVEQYLSTGGIPDNVAPSSPTSIASPVSIQSEVVGSVSSPNLNAGNLDVTTAVPLAQPKSEEPGAGPVELSVAGAPVTPDGFDRFNELPSVVNKSIGAVTNQEQGAVSSGNKASAATVVSDESIRVNLGRIERLLNYVGELVILQTVLREQVNGNNPLLLKKTADQLGKVTKEIQDISMSFRMVPMKQTFQKMQRIVRDTASTLEKKINLVLSGEETELDKTVLEYLGDPLLHLIRNACDHGIEDGKARLAKGKPEAGTIFLSAFHQGGEIIIQVEDDGGGIDAQLLVKKAISKGLLKEGTELPEKDALQIIFLPGFSTKTEVSEISGRGVGLDVVKSNIEKIQGVIQISTKISGGTKFRIALPLTMAIIEAMVIRCNQERFVLPLGHIHEALQATLDDVKTVSGVGEVFSLRGEHLPLYRLTRLLGRKGKEAPLEESIIIVVRSGKAPFSVLVDDILGQQQIVIKRLGKELKFLSGYSGSAILGDGRPALILELPEMLKKYRPDYAAISTSAA